MCILLLIGFPGSIFARLSVGQHTIDVRFTPTGSTQVTAFQLQFNIAGNYLLCETIAYNFANDTSKYSFFINYRKFLSNNLMYLTGLYQITALLKCGNTLQQVLVYFECVSF